MSDSPSVCDSYALVLGEEADLESAVVQARGAHSVLSYSFRVAVELESKLGFRPDVVDVTGYYREIQDLAWAWTQGLLSAVCAAFPEEAHAALQSSKRMLLLHVFMPIAAARLKAVLVTEGLPEGTAVLALGVGAREAIELNALSLMIGGDLQTTGDTREPSRRVSERVRASLRIVPLVLKVTRRQLRRPFTLRRLRRTTRALRRSQGGHAPALLLLAGAPVHLGMLSSSIAELRSRGWSITVGECGPAGSLSSAASERGLPVIGFPAFVEAAESIGELIARRAQRRDLLARGTEWARSVGLEAHAGDIVAGLTERYEATRGFMRAHHEMLSAFVPDILLTVNEINPVVETSAVVGRDMLIPTVNIQHGSAVNMPLNTDFPFDAFCVWGEADAETFVALGTLPQRIRVTGNPYEDDRVATRNSEQGRARGRAHQRRSHPAKPFSILFAGGYAWDLIGDQSLYETLGMVLDYADRRPDCRVVLKLHPVGAGKELGYEVALREHQGVSVTVTRDADLRDLLVACDCVATHASTVAIEAVPFRKTVILLNPGSQPDFLPLVGEGVALRATTASELQDCVDRLRRGEVISEASFARFERRYSSRPDGRAGVRIADVCEELANVTSTRAGRGKGNHEASWRQ